MSAAKNNNVARRRDNGTVQSQAFARDTSLAALRLNFEIGDLVIRSNNAVGLPDEYTNTSGTHAISRTETQISANVVGLAATNTPYPAVAGVRDTVVNLAYNNTEFSLPYLPTQSPLITHVGTERQLTFDGGTRQLFVNNTLTADGLVVITRVDPSQVGLAGGRVWVRFVGASLAPQVNAQ